MHRSPVNFEELVAARLFLLPPVKRALEAALPLRLSPRLGVPAGVQVRHELRGQEVEVFRGVPYARLLDIGGLVLAAAPVPERRRSGGRVSLNNSGGLLKTSQSRLRPCSLSCAGLTAGPSLSHGASCFGTFGNFGPTRNTHLTSMTIPFLTCRVSCQHRNMQWLLTERRGALGRQTI